MNTLLIAFIIFCLGFVGLQGFVRLAPVDVSDWHVTPMMPDVGEGDWPLRNGTRVARDYEARPEEVLARVQGIALATDRTRLIAGSVEEGLLTFETRSAFWGFPDYTSISARSDGSGARVEIYARQGIGAYDWGVNAARVSDWLEAMGQVASGS